MTDIAGDHIIPKIQSELADMRDVHTVMISILKSHDSSIVGLSTEVRDLRSQFDRFQNEISEMTSYESDLAAWAMEQADALRLRSVNRLDWDNLAEEIEAAGISQRREVVSRLTLLCHHLLKWQFQPEHQSRSWQATIRTQRRDLARVLKDSPSLRPYAAAELDEAFAAGREDAEYETGLLRLPDACPWTIQQVLNLNFLPGA